VTDNTNAQAIQQIQTANRGIIAQLQRESVDLQERNKLLAGNLQRYAELFQKVKGQLDQTIAANRSLESTVATLRGDNKTLNEQVRTLLTELNFLINQAQMLQSEAANGGNQLLDSVHLLAPIYDDQAQIEPAKTDLSLDLHQTLTTYEPAVAVLVGENSDGDTIPLDMDAVEAELARIEAEDLSRDAA
jgi:chromosome segregation ATPase